MLVDFNRSGEKFESIELGKENRRLQVETFQEKFQKTVIDAKANVLEKKSQSIKEDISDFIRNWFREM